MTSLVLSSILLLTRLLSAQYSPITDCDETFNYLEPAHYLLHHSGFQTWEYSPIFGLRSYAYLQLHLLPLRLFSVPLEKEYLLLKGCLGLLCVLGESRLVLAVRTRFGVHPSLLLFFFLWTSAGMFHASTAMLPSSMCMVMTMYAYADWLLGNKTRALLFGSFAVLMAWPFCALVFVPMGMDVLMDPQGLFKGVQQIGVVLVVGLTLFAILPSVYDRLVCVCWNISSSNRRRMVCWIRNIFVG